MPRTTPKPVPFKLGSYEKDYPLLAAKPAPAAHAAPAPSTPPLPAVCTTRQLPAIIHAQGLYPRTASKGTVAKWRALGLIRYKTLTGCRQMVDVPATILAFKQHTY